MSVVFVWGTKNSQALEDVQVHFYSVLIVTCKCQFLVIQPEVTSFPTHLAT